MFIDTYKRWYTRDGQQQAVGPFIILFTHETAKFTKSEPIRAAVRRVHMKQLGHWMMGEANLWGHKITLSGSYGADGLTNTCPSQELWDKLHPLPVGLVEAFWTDGSGWNSAGVTSGPLIERWAAERVATLRRALVVPVAAGLTTD